MINRKIVKKIPILCSIFIILGLSVGLSINISAEEGLIPSWIKNTAGFWVEGQVSDSEFISAIQYMIDEGILVMKRPSEIENKTEILNENQDSFVIEKPARELKSDHQHNIFQVIVDDDGTEEDCRKNLTCFKPRQITIKETDTIKITNEGNAEHRLTSADRYLEPNKEQFYNITLQSGDSFEYTYNEVGGTFYITCLNHPHMKMIVHVQALY